MATNNSMAADAANNQRFEVFNMDSFARRPNPYSQSHSLNKSLIG